MRDIVEAALDTSIDPENAAGDDEFRDPRLGLVGCGPTGIDRLSAVANETDPTRVVVVGDSAGTRQGVSRILGPDPTPAGISETLRPLEEGDVAVTLAGPVGGAGGRIADSEGLVDASTVVTTLDGVARTGALSICVVALDAGSDPPQSIVEAADLTIPVPVDVSDRTVEAMTTAVATPLTDSVPLPLNVLDLWNLLASGRVATPLVAVGAADEPPECVVAQALDSPLHGTLPDGSVEWFCHLTLGPDATNRDVDEITARLREELGRRTARCERGLRSGSVDDDRSGEWRLVALLLPTEGSNP